MPYSLSSRLTVEAQVRKDRELKEELFEVSPKGFWLPELAYDPIIPAILKDNGYGYVFADGEAMLLSDHLNSAVKPIKPLYPHLIKAQRGGRQRFPQLHPRPQGAEKSGGKGLPPGKVTLEAVKNIDAVPPVWVAINTAVMLGIGRFPLMNQRKQRTG